MFIGMEEVCFAQMTTAHGGAGVEVAVGCCSSVVLARNGTRFERINHGLLLCLLLLLLFYFVWSVRCVCVLFLCTTSSVKSYSNHKAVTKHDVYCYQKLI